MSTTDKKARVRAIFDLVHAAERLEEVIAHERPDFLARRTNQDRRFGVEIAEFYHSETDARLHRIPGYSGDLLDGKIVRHKDEWRNLEVEKVDILNKDDQIEARGVPAIIQRVPSFAECARKVAEKITEKDLKLHDAVSELSHVNLIIRDNTHLLGHVPASAFYRVYFVAELSKAVTESQFREILFITDLNGRLSIMPLKLLYFISELFYFGPVYAEFVKTNVVPPGADEFDSFASYVQGIVKSEVVSRKDGDAVEIIYGDTGLVVTEDRAVRVRMHLDYPLPIDARPARRDLLSILGTAFAERMAEYRKNHTFATELCFPIGPGLNRLR